MTVWTKQKEDVQEQQRTLFGKLSSSCPLQLHNQSWRLPETSSHSQVQRTESRSIWVSVGILGTESEALRTQYLEDLTMKAPPVIWGARQGGRWEEVCWQGKWEEVGRGGRFEFVRWGEAWRELDEGAAERQNVKKKCGFFWNYINDFLDFFSFCY